MRPLPNPRAPRLAQRLIIPPRQASVTSPLSLATVGMPSQRVCTVNVGPVGLRESLAYIILALFADTPALVFVQEAKLQPRPVRNLKG